MAPPETNILDHIVHLVEPGQLDKAIERFTSIGFKVVPGGTHTGGLTYNALVVLSDTLYLELLAFTHDVSYYPPGSPERAARENHSWAKKHPGWIDYAFLGTDPSISRVINARGGGKVQYNEPVDGGRTRGDGVELKWIITGPNSNLHPGGSLPFFCGDVTPRKLRVPLDPPSNTVHPSTASGIAHVHLVALNLSTYTALIPQYTAVIGSPPASTSSKRSTWRLAPNATLILTILSDGLESSGHSIDKGNVVGLWEVGFWVQKGNKNAGQVEASFPFGRVKWVEAEL